MSRCSTPMDGKHRDRAMHLTQVAQFVVGGSWQSIRARCWSFRDWFADEAACRDYLAGLRWPEGFRCPICCVPDHWVTTRGLRPLPGVRSADLGDGGDLVHRHAFAVA